MDCDKLHEIATEIYRIVTDNCAKFDLNITQASLVDKIEEILERNFDTDSL